MPASWNGSVILDIGGDIGALVLRTTSELFGHEINLVPDDASTPQVHSAVRERRALDGSSFAAVYPQLKEGAYTIEGSTQCLAVQGGQIVDVILDEIAFVHDISTHKGEHHVHR
jgi:hypothetical protein